MLNLSEPLGFQGLRPDLPVTRYERHLPHWRQPGATYFVTFRQSDSIPQEKLRELAAFRTDWLLKHPPPIPATESEAMARLLFRRIEKWLDQGIGECHLKRIEIRTLLIEALHFFDGTRYDLVAYVIMPNHVHCVIRPLQCDAYPLERLLRTIKQRSAMEINRMIGAMGALWQSESFDRIIRDAEHLYRCVQYIGNNPLQAGIDETMSIRWLCPKWEKAGWQFDWDQATM